MTEKLSPKEHLNKKDMLAVIHEAETARTAEGKRISLQQAITKLRQLIAEIDFSQGPNFDEVTGVLQAVRIEVGLLLKLSSSSFLADETVKWLVEAKKVLDQWHRRTRILLLAKDHNFDLESNGYCFEIELQRDTAQFLQKLGDLTGQPKYYEFAAYVLRRAIQTAEPKNQSKPAAALARFERQINLDLAGKASNRALLLALHREIELGSPDNWDRQAAVSWWLYEYGYRHHDQELKEYGLVHAKQAVIKGGQQKWETYQAKRVIANFFGRCQQTQFKISHGQTETESDEYLRARGLNFDDQLT